MNMGPPTARSRMKQLLLGRTVGLMLPAATAVLGPAIALSHGTIKFAWILVLAGTAALAGLIANIRQRALGGYKEAATEVYARVYGAGHPVLIALRDLCTASDHRSADSALSELRRCVLETAIEACGPPSGKADQRAVSYDLTATELRRVKFKGRDADVAPRAAFSSTHPADRNVVEWVRGASSGGRPVADLVKNVKIEHTRGSVDGHADYLSYVSRPVYRPGKNLGLLCVDNTRAGNFIEADIQTMGMLSNILAAGMAHVEALTTLRASSEALISGAPRDAVELLDGNRRDMQDAEEE